MAGQDSLASRFTAGLTIVSTQGDYKAFTDAPYGFGFEATGDITRHPDQALNFRGFLSYAAVSGKYRAALDNTFSLNGLSLGAEATFKTPSDKIRPYAGIMLTKWSGSSKGLGKVLVAERQIEFDSHPKMGFRFGVDYTINDHIVVGACYSMSEWRAHRDYSQSVTNALVIDGFNPVNPSWVNVTCRWRF
jgi:hypothetical protein